MSPVSPNVLQHIADDAGATPTLPHLVGGTWQHAHSGKTFDVVEPATGELLAKVPDGGAEDLDLAVRVGLEAQATWAATPIVERAAVLRELSARVANAADDFGLLDARDNGSPRAEMRADAIKGANALRYVAGLGFEMRGDTIPVRNDTLHFTQLQPWGVVGRVIAFNHPTLFTCGRLAPALMAGNAVVLKMPELAPLAGLAVAEIAEDLLPDGLLSVLTGGPALGAALARHPEIRRLSFTGSVATALKIAEGAAASGVIKTVTYELGGKNPMIVFPDADVEQAADAAVRGMNFTRVQGQSCGSTSRLFLHEDVYDDMLDDVIERTRRIRIGDPTRHDVEMGALINRSARDRCLGVVERAQQAGAQVVLGGGIPAGAEFERGAFMEPTILVGADHGSELAQDEIFGPVLSVHRWSDEDEVVRLANDVKYGLTAAVWTSDVSRALTVANRLDAGYIWINDVESRYPAVPFGGWKDSGSGLEHGIEELLSFTRAKAVNIRHG